MTATNPPPPAEAGQGRRSRRRLGAGGFVSAALFALAPKCGLCLLSYAGLGAALGLGGAEICGATPSSASVWLTWLAGLGLALTTLAWFSRGQGLRSVIWKNPIYPPGSGDPGRVSGPATVVDV